MPFPICFCIYASVVSLRRLSPIGCDIASVRWNEAFPRKWQSPYSQTFNSDDQDGHIGVIFMASSFAAHIPDKNFLLLRWHTNLSSMGLPKKAILIGIGLVAL